MVMQIKLIVVVVAAEKKKIVANVTNNLVTTIWQSLNPKKFKEMFI